MYLVFGTLHGVCFQEMVTNHISSTPRDLCVLRLAAILGSQSLCPRPPIWEMHLPFPAHSPHPSELKYSIVPILTPFSDSLKTYYLLPYFICPADCSSLPVEWKQTWMHATTPLSGGRSISGKVQLPGVGRPHLANSYCWNWTCNTPTYNGSPG